MFARAPFPVKINTIISENFARCVRISNQSWIYCFSLITWMRGRGIVMVTYSTMLFPVLSITVKTIGGNNVTHIVLTGIVTLILEAYCWLNQIQTLSSASKIALQQWFLQSKRDFHYTPKSTKSPEIVLKVPGGRGFTPDPIVAWRDITHLLLCLQ